MKRRIMVVEDESFQRGALEVALQRRFADADVIVESFADPMQALSRAYATHFAVVIADFRMPGMNGVAFLQKLRELQPVAVRLMLTASAEIDTAVMALNYAEVFRFIRKPWDQSLHVAVQEALARYEELCAAEVPQAVIGTPPKAAAAHAASLRSAIDVYTSADGTQLAR